MIDRRPTSGPRIAVIGGGIAGVSAAAALVADPVGPDVVLLEAEQQLAHHTTGRSAAQLIENYGAGPVRPLTTASLPYFRAEPGVHHATPFLRPQPVLTVGRPDQDEVIEAQLAAGRAANPDIAEISPGEAGELFPPLRTDRLSRVIIEPGSSDIDVSALHQSFVRSFVDRGGRIETLARVDAVRPPARAGGPWRVESTKGWFEADLVVNAAGAWGDSGGRAGRGGAGRPGAEASHGVHGGQPMGRLGRLGDGGRGRVGLVPEAGRPPVPLLAGRRDTV